MAHTMPRAYGYSQDNDLRVEGITIFHTLQILEELKS